MAALLLMAAFCGGPLADRQIEPLGYGPVFWTFEARAGHEAALKRVGEDLFAAGGVWVMSPQPGLGYALLGGMEGQVYVARFNIELHSRIDALLRSGAYPPGEDDTSLRSAFVMRGTLPLAADAMVWALDAVQHLGLGRDRLHTGWEPGIDEPGEDTRTWPGLIGQLRKTGRPYDAALVARVLKRWRADAPGDAPPAD